MDRVLQSKNGQPMETARCPVASWLHLDAAQQGQDHNDQNSGQHQCLHVGSCTSNPLGKTNAIKFQKFRRRNSDWESCCVATARLARANEFKMVVTKLCTRLRPR